jgi:ribosomal protein S15P/S13E
MERRLSIMMGKREKAVAYLKGTTPDSAEAHFSAAGVCKKSFHIMFLVPGVTARR